MTVLNIVEGNMCTSSRITRPHCLLAIESTPRFDQRPRFSLWPIMWYVVMVTARAPSRLPLVNAEMSLSGRVVH